jgi:hypothetical protein
MRITEIEEARRGNASGVRQQKGIYKVFVNTHGDPEDSWATNAIKYDTVPIAVEAAKDLFSRWTAVKFWRVMDVTQTTVYAEGP